MNRYKLKEVLNKHKTVAIIGLSRNPSKDSHAVAKYLQKQGFRIIPVNPTADKILGEKSYKSLTDMPTEVRKSVEIVDIFRPSHEVPAIMEEIIEMKKAQGVPFVVWTQLGITSNEATDKARESGLTVIMNKCMMQEHKRLIAPKIN